MPTVPPFTGQTAVGTAAALLSSESQPFSVGVLLQALPANTGNLYYGFVIDIPLDDATTANGMPFNPDGSAFIPNLQASDLEQIWVISDTAGQNVGYSGI